MFAAITRQPWGAVGWRPHIAVVPAVRRPLPGIAQHAEQAEWIRRKAVHVGQITIVERTTAAIAVRIAFAQFVTPPASSCRAAPRGVFPFRLAREPVRSRPIRRSWPGLTHFAV